MSSLEGHGLLIAAALLAFALVGPSCQRPRAAVAANPQGRPEPRRRVVDEEQPPTATAASPATAASSEGTAQEGSADHAEWATLPLEGFEPALVSLPRGKLDGAPLLVATHGAGGTAEWHCQHWRRMTEARGFILCLAGKRMIASPSVESGYYYPDHLALGREVEAALAEFRIAYPNADSKSPVYAGYSQGASMGALALAELEPTFPRVALVEGGFAEWSLSRAQRFEARGGRRILFVCGRRSCADGARRSTRWLRRSGIEVATVLAPSAGHTPNGLVEEKTLELLPWLLDGDPRWISIEP